MDQVAKPNVRLAAEMANHVPGLLDAADAAYAAYVAVPVAVAGDGALYPFDRGPVIACPVTFEYAEGGPFPCGRDNDSLWLTIQHLNDTHEWTREAIADWLDELHNSGQVDLSVTWDDEKEEAA